MAYCCNCKRQNYSTTKSRCNYQNWSQVVPSLILPRMFSVTKIFHWISTKCVKVLEIEMKKCSISTVNADWMALHNVFNNVLNAE